MAKLAVVTGASGHVGCNLVRALLEDGEAVRALVHEDGAGLDGLEVERVPGDVLDPASLEAAFAGADVVYHLAAVISIRGELGGRVSRVNVEGPRNVAQAARRCGVRRLVHCSSIHAFDLADTARPVDEAHPRAVSPRHGAYDRSKHLGEQEVRAAIGEGLDAVIVHPTAVIGRHDYRPSRMGQVFLGLQRRSLPSLIDGGFDWVDVRDVVWGLRAAADRGATGENYILSGEWRSVVELAALAGEVTGVRPPRFTSPMWLARLGSPFMDAWARVTSGEPLYTSESLAALRCNRQVSHQKASEALGYAARPLSETVRDLYGWFAEVGWLAGRGPGASEGARATGGGGAAGEELAG